MSMPEQPDDLDRTAKSQHRRARTTRRQTCSGAWGGIQCSARPPDEHATFCKAR
ncbi:MAG TPA: hypothetical protein VGJ00_01795 [Rhabdochlamydiaceae bacterium]